MASNSTLISHGLALSGTRISAANTPLCTDCFFVLKLKRRESENGDWLRREPGFEVVEAFADGACPLFRTLLNKVTGGIAVFGAAADPIEICRGPTGRRALNYNGSTALEAAEAGQLCLPSPPEHTIGSGKKGKSLRNVNRGDWIRTSDLLTPSQTRYPDCATPRF